MHSHKSFLYGQTVNKTSAKIADLLWELAKTATVEAGMQVLLTLLATDIV